MKTIKEIWKKEFKPGDLTIFGQECCVGHLGIAFVEKGPDYLKATMPVDKRTVQPMGILHGGASVVLAETMGSTASHMVLDDSRYSVGLEIKANHIKSVSEGIVTGTVRPVHLGNTTQVWDITIENSKKELVCVSRLTMAVLKA